MIGLQVVLYYKNALSCATLTAGWEKDATKCIDVIKLAIQLSDGKFFSPVLPVSAKLYQLL